MMSDYKIIRKIHMDCDICDKVHEVEEREGVNTLLINGEKIEYTERYFYCYNGKENENKFVTGKMCDDNLMNARNAYRAKKGLLSSDEIVSIRESYALSQVDLSRLLGWGEATISRYESKAIQDETHDIMLRLIKDNPLKALEFLRKNEDKFSDAKKKIIKENIIERIDLYGKEYLSRQSLLGEYVNFEEPSDSNGNTTLNIDKLEAAISYIAKRDPNLYKVKLMKMLWYADALSYKKYDHSITGLVYRHNNMGSLPIGHYCIMNLEKINTVEEESERYDSMIHIYPLEDIDYGVLGKEDKKILDVVIKKFVDYRAKEIVEYMHKEKAYKNTKSGDIIPFSLAKELSI